MFHASMMTSKYMISKNGSRKSTGKAICENTCKDSLRSLKKPSLAKQKSQCTDDLLAVHYKLNKHRSTMSLTKEAIGQILPDRGNLKTYMLEHLPGLNDIKKTKLN